MPLRRVNLAGGENVLTSATLDELRGDLKHPVIKVYVVAGQEADDVWNVGCASCAMRQPEYNVYLVDCLDVIRDLLPKNLRLGKAMGVLFPKNKPPRLVTPVEACSSDTLDEILGI
jgi:hypothetical protein